MSIICIGNPKSAGVFFFFFFLGAIYVISKLDIYSGHVRSEPRPRFDSIYIYIYIYYSIRVLLPCCFYS